MSAPSNPATLHDIQGPIPLSPTLDWRLVALVSVVLLLAAGLYWYWRKRQGQKTSPAISAGTLALEELRQARALMVENQILLYLERVSTILRHYIEARFLIRASRQTTPEFLTCLRASADGTSPLAAHRQQLAECLQLCDLAKFAHQPASLAAMEEVETAVSHFVLETQDPPADGTKGGR